MSDASSNIVLHLELYEGCEMMQKKPYIKELGATATTTLNLTEHYQGSDRIVMIDSWLGSVKSAKALMQKRL